MAIADRHGLPVAVHIESATPHEVALVKATIAQRLVLKTPADLVGDVAYESDQAQRSGQRAEFALIVI